MQPSPVDRARRAAAELLLCYVDARDTNEREAISRIVAELTGGPSASIAELAADALQTTRVDA